MNTTLQIQGPCKDDVAGAEAGLSPAIPLKGVQPHFMLIPSMACPATCSYCFGPHRGPIMSVETMGATLDFMGRTVGETGQRQVRVTFHGGEPLMAGHALWRQALDGLTARFGQQQCRVALQSNLWLLDDEFCRLFCEHKVDVGTSLDGPEEITDDQRGRGYFGRTMSGVRRAQAHGIKVGCIATFTPTSMERWREVFDFFLRERLGFSIHAAVPPLDHRGSPFALKPVQYATLLRQMLDYYVEHRHDLSVSSLDQMCRCVGCGDGKVCTFRDCLGMFVAIDPNGDLYPCQRFCGQPQYRFGTLWERPSLANILASPIAQRMAARQQQVHQACDGCAHVDYCRGGCPYNAWAGDNGDRIRDPYCEAYREVLDYIQQRVVQEMASEENINAIADRAWDRAGHPLLRKGPLIELVREGPHPSQVARTAKRIVAAVELAKGPDLTTVAARLVQIGICRTRQSAEASLQGLWCQLYPANVRLNKLYVHVTFNCQLHCTHCYACAGEVQLPRSSRGKKARTLTPAVSVEMPVAAVEKLIHEAMECGFRHVVITGGEPLVHSQRNAMLDMLAEARTWAAPMNLVLRTNFALPLDEAKLLRIALAFNQVVASVDGDQESHDARRGRGTHAATVHNLEAYVSTVRNWQPAMGRPAELSLACAMRAADIRGEPGLAVRELARGLGIRRAPFRPLLPLGRAQDSDEPLTSEALRAHSHPMELIEDDFHPVASCGLGQNLYVEPSGESFPCYAYHQPHSLLGNVVDSGLPAILESERFHELSQHTADTNPKCRVCGLRYLCGGACRAWGGEACQHDVDAPPPECVGLRARARDLLATAADYLKIETPPEGDTPCLHH